MSIASKVHSARTLIRAGFFGLERPDRLVKVASLVRRWGPTPSAGYAAAALRYPDETAILDELGSLTFAEVHGRTNRLANALGAAGIREKDGIAIMCRNHRGFVESIVACSKLGANALLLNTSFAGPQLTEVVKREKPAAVIFDEEFTELMGDATAGRKRFIGWHEDRSSLADPTLEELEADGDAAELVPPEKPGKVVILTSGTTGAPKGASRSQPKSLEPAAALLDRIPLHAREHTMIAAPLFHSWGFAHFTLGMGLCSTLVLRRKFDPEGTLQAVSEHRATALVVVPVMLQRILELPEEVRRRHDLSTLRVIAASGSALPAPLSAAAMDAFGDVLYNLYGSTEVAWATIATPEDLRRAPGTAGRPPYGTVVRLYDEQGRRAPEGETGRIFVGNEMLFEGYTGGGSKDEIDGLMATGDVGHFVDGLLMIDGRDDDMIVSGGENVFPGEVEDLLSGHPSVADVAVIGVDDEEFGQRLKAIVVEREGTSTSESELKKFVKDNLAGYKVPREFAFVEELPRTSTGKVLKRELK